MQITVVLPEPDSDNCKQIETALTAVMGENECLMAADLVAVSHIDKPFGNANYKAWYQISFRTEVAVSETNEAALVNAQQIFAQSFASCQRNPMCIEGVNDVIELPDDMTFVTALMQYTHEDTILWKVIDVLQLSPSFTNRIEGSGCDLDCYNTHCEICQLESEIENWASDLGTVFRNVFVTQYIDLNFQGEGNRAQFQ